MSKEAIRPIKYGRFRLVGNRLIYCEPPKCSIWDRATLVSVEGIFAKGLDGEADLNSRPLVTACKARGAPRQFQVDYNQSRDAGTAYKDCRSCIWWNEDSDVVTLD
jgi:hypothetical protein